MQRDLVYLADILESARLAVSYLQGLTKESFLKNTQCQDSVIRRIEIIGEAARRISSSTQTAFPELPWNQMIGMRNLMIHEYDDIDLEIVWDTVQLDLPRLIALIEPRLPSEEP